MDLNPKSGPKPKMDLNWPTKTRINLKRPKTEQ